MGIKKININIFRALIIIISSNTLLLASSGSSSAQCSNVFSNKNSTENLAYLVCSSQNFIDEYRYPKTAIFGAVYFQKKSNPYDYGQIPMQAVVSCYQYEVSWSRGMRKSLSRSAFKKLNLAMINYVCR